MIIEQFQHYIRNWYQLYGRHTLPWRLTSDPYQILVSEMMLQQTQVERVIPKYQQFLERFPDETTLATATLAEVLQLWVGLGYNRRAKYLHSTARAVVVQGGKWPTSETALRELPGVGPYTAGAIMAFAYNQPVTLIETNVRTVFIYHFFPERSRVADSELLPLIEQSIDHSNPRQWYWALMDYGVHLKKVLPNPSRLSKHHTKQAPFLNSRREVRGQIISELSQQSHLNRHQLQQLISGNQDYFDVALAHLVKEGMVRENTGLYSISDTHG